MKNLKVSVEKYLNLMFHTLSPPISLKLCLPHLSTSNNETVVAKTKVVTELQEIVNGDARNAWFGNEDSLRDFRFFLRTTD